MYASQADIIALYGEDALYGADVDGDGQADDAIVTRALEEASLEIDSYVGARYPLPLPTSAAEHVRRRAVDIALYMIAQRRDVLTEELRTRYEDANDWLKDIAKGMVSLPVATSDGEADPGFDRPRPIVQSGPEREFSREKLRGL